MTPERLLANFDRISEAPYAIPRLRRFILDLAVRGKLVEQDPNDEPAPELVKRIRAEKPRVVKEGGIKKEKTPPPLIQEALPFRLPVNWYWSQLAEIGYLNPRNTAADKLLASFVPMPLIPAEYGAASKHEVRPWEEIKSGYTHFAEGDVALAKITPCFENGKSTIFRGLTGGIGAGTTELHVVRPVIVSVEYILIFLKCPFFIESGIPRMTGTAGQKRVPTEYFAYSPFPVPPLAEQHRIVAKVDELMALCDRLEAAQAERESRRDRLAAASLHRLNNGADVESFREHARFHFGHLPRLTTRREHLQQLRQTILNLAVRGKLVPQDRNDEPACELLKRIQAEKARLLKEGEAKPQKQQRPMTDAVEPFSIPESWRWISVGDIAFGFRYGTSVKCSYEPKGEPVLRIPNVANGRIDIEDLKYGLLSEREADDLRLRLGDILIVRSNGSLNLVGRPALVEAQAVGFCYAGYLVRLRTSTVHLDSYYLLLALNTAHVRDQIEIPIRTTVGLKNVNATELSGLTIPLPPVAEQHRVVGKVDELMTLCDRLEAQLNTTQTESRRLLEAVLHEALNGAD